MSEPARVYRWIAGPRRSARSRGAAGGEVWRIAWLGPGSATASGPYVSAFEKVLADRGHIKGRTVTIEYVFLPPSRDQLRQAASSLKERVDILVTWGTVGAIAAKEAAVTCPVVFASVSFPATTGLVASLRHPGGNFTGIGFESADETYGKRLQLLKEIVPGLTRIATLGAADDPNVVPSLDTIRRVTPGLALGLIDIRVRNATDLPRAFEDMSKKKVQGVLVIAGAFTFAHRDRVAELALAHRLPSVHGLRDGVAAGGLVGLGPDLLAMSGQVAGYVDKIIQGARPGDLPQDQEIYQLTSPLATRFM